MSKTKGKGNLFGKINPSKITVKNQDNDLGSLFVAVNRPLTNAEQKQSEAIAINRISGLNHGIITHTSFHYLSDEEIRNYSGDIVVKEYREGIDPTIDFSNTPNDPRMGTIERGQFCTTCKQTPLHCPGHPGRIDLGTCFIHPEEIKSVINVLTAVCNTCSGLKITREQLEKQNVMRLTGRARLQAIADLCKPLTCKHQLDSKNPNSGGHKVESTFKNYEYDIVRLENIKPCLKNPEYDIARNKNSHVVTYSYVFKDETSKTEKSKHKKKYFFGRDNTNCPADIDSKNALVRIQIFAPTRRLKLSLNVYQVKILKF